MKYKMTVGTTSSVIVPDATNLKDVKAKGGEESFATGELFRWEDGGPVYWALGGGPTERTKPPFSNGIEGYGLGSLMTVAPKRNVIISADRNVPIWITRGTVAVVGEGIPIDSNSPAIDFGDYAGPVAAISEGSADIAISIS